MLIYLENFSLQNGKHKLKESEHKFRVDQHRHRYLTHLLVHKFCICKFGISCDHWTFPHPDGQHDMSVALQDLHCIAVGDVIEAHPIGCKDLIAHFDAVLLCETSWVQPEEQKQTQRKVGDTDLLNTNSFEQIWYITRNVATLTQFYFSFYDS